MSQDLIQFKVTGVVQGVNFRSHTQKEAQKLGLRGHCYNHEDQSVQGAAVGPSQKIEEFRRYLEKGPPSAAVHGVELIKEIRGASDDQIQGVIGKDSGFQVKR
ncbi:hypothetical protein L198_02218 [Cryptococcus wingfieldii CBS 7118]|uniref:acylphosphatase n=1 Tax=Cryptococcus wingfieldii CBS 7118 TaxID=1295528 RepID=A0A1E3JTV5_9TREE|nr:hypothetical protein L198_02218 [Cryptococcus wingfieldii CBS 7118]ODO03372.1 hypothetical protein L198_02218 [Cryptococcus wingfieldii CBS 7118]